MEMSYDNPVFDLEDVGSENTASGYPHSPLDLSSPTLSYTDTSDFNRMPFYVDRFHEEPEYSHLSSPSSNLSEYGASLPAYPGFLQSVSTFDTNKWFTSHSSAAMSHSVPDEHHYLTSRPATIPNLHLQAHPEDGDDGHLDVRGRPVPQLFLHLEPASYLEHCLGGVSALDSKHLGYGSSAMSRTPSATSSRSFEDFKDSSSEGYSVNVDGTEGSHQHTLGSSDSRSVGASATEERHWPSLTLSTMATPASSDRSTTTPPLKAAKGRKGKLTEQSRLRTARMRKIGACSTCRARRAKVSRSPFFPPCPPKSACVLFWSIV
jgi:hypothetical protein